VYAGGVTRRLHLAFLGISTLLASLAVLPGAAQAPAISLEEATVAQLQEAMAEGRYTAAQLVDLYLERIEALDRSGPTLRSIIEINPDARSIAASLDEERKAGRVRGPLHGIPIVVKDNIDTGDRMMTTAGSLALEGGSAPRDAFVVTRLREAGVVILGKANLSEWANFRSTNSTSGWSGRGGQVRNPYVLDRNPCGSSSGSGVAVAANLATMAVGTETDGSVVCPSAANGIVGIKPTVGMVSRSGIIPISKTQDTAGPMARTVTDAALLLSAMAGADKADEATQSAGSRDVDFSTALDPGALKGARIGVPRQRYFGYSPKTDAVIEEAIGVLRGQGAVIVDPADIPTAAQLSDCEFEVLLYEFKAGLNAYFATRPDAKVKTLEELIAFNSREAERELRVFGQEILEMAQKKGGLASPEYKKALTTCRTRARTEGIDAVMKKHQLDALIAPTGSPAWPIDLVNGDHFSGASSSPAAIAGYPNVTVPAGYVEGLPVGISFFGRAWTDAKLIGLAYAYEQATKHRRPPTFIPSLPLR
jgi:amidase